MNLLINFPFKQEKNCITTDYIQQYSLQKIQKIISKGESKDLKTYQKIVTRSLFGNINASRNSA